MRLPELNILYSVGKSVTSLSDMNQLLPRIVDAAIKVTRAEEGQLFLLENGRLFCRAAKRHNEAQATTCAVPSDDPVAKHVAQTGQSLLLTPEQLSKTPRAPLSVASVPLIVRGEVIGALTVTNISSSARVFSKHDGALLSALSDYAAIAIENSRLYEALRDATEREKL
jgi:two-component system NtrC family sensor kinase